MNKSLALKWVKNLRSKKFKQGQMNLRRSDDGVTEHCCLGVLGEICGIDQVFLDNESALDCDEVREVCQIEDAEGIPTDDAGVKVRVGNSFKTFGSLAQANDEGASFKSIATWIENNYKRL